MSAAVGIVLGLLAVLAITSRENGSRAFADAVIGGDRFERYVLPIVERHAVRITSYRRSTERNAAVGGSDTSDHLTGQAVDLVGIGGPVEAARAIVRDLRAAGLPYDQVIAYHRARGGHLHVGARCDGRPNRGEIRVQPATGRTILLTTGIPTDATWSAARSALEV